MSLLALVPMKGNSERVPGKNLKTIAGRPLFHWITDTLLKAVMVDEVLIDTDSDEIESAVTAAFPEVILHRRPKHLHGDFVPMHDIVAHIANTVDHDHLLQTHSTNPLLTPHTIDRAIETFLEDGDHDSLMSVTAWKSRFYFSDGRPVNHDPTELIRTQDLQPLLEENSNIYIAPTSVIRETGFRVGKKPFLFKVDPTESVDIDEQLDFDLAEFLLRGRCG